MIYTYEKKKTVDKKSITETIELDINPGLLFHGEVIEEEKELRRFFGLPLTKPLIRKKRADYPNWETLNVNVVKVEELYSDWFVLNVDGVRIHSAFFAHMQKPDFESEMMFIQE